MAATSRSDVGSDPGTPTDRSWRMADQYFLDGDVEVNTVQHSDGYVMTVKIGDAVRRVFFDPAGRITHTLRGR